MFDQSQVVPIYRVLVKAATQTEIGDTPALVGNPQSGEPAQVGGLEELLKERVLGEMAWRGARSGNASNFPVPCCL
jgi:hypothetical protein